MEPPPGTQQRGPVEQDGGTQLRLQDGSPDGSNDSVSVDGPYRESLLWAHISHTDHRKMFTLNMFESLVVCLRFCYKISVKIGILSLCLL